MNRRGMPTIETSLVDYLGLGWYSLHDNRGRVQQPLYVDAGQDDENWERDPSHGAKVASRLRFLWNVWTGVPS